ncbi:MAG TPA: cation:proton antiporter, partial [Polyangiaceae bacterium]|nr:cation:proton antiporter [Polyangiaceae bacterium]
SPRDLRDNWRQITGLALLAVGATVVVVALVARALVPAMPWAAAVALGAIVAPPDAAAATAVLKQLPLPRRLIVILEGESLFNDASALLIYRAAVATAITGAFSGWTAMLLLAASSVGSVLLGVVLARVAMLTLARISHPATAVLLQFLSTFAVWILAERLHLSGIITVVVFGIAAARWAPSRTPARLRVPTNAVWEVIVFVLNVLAFILVGLQLGPILQRLADGQLASYLTATAAVCAAVILVRIAWVLLYEAGANYLRPRFARARNKPTRHPSSRAALLVAWCGMRGTVTLAAALALPVGSATQPAFPQRDFILFSSYCVVLVTLVLQGLTLSPLIRWLALDDDRMLEREVILARKALAEAGLAALDSETEPDTEGAWLRRKYQIRVSHYQTPAEPHTNGAPNANAEHPTRRALAAERRTLSDLRSRGIIGDDAFHRVEEELDWAELNTDAKLS